MDLNKNKEKKNKQVLHEFDENYKKTVVAMT